MTRMMIRFDHDGHVRVLQRPKILNTAIDGVLRWFFTFRPEPDRNALKKTTFLPRTHQPVHDVVHQDNKSHTFPFRSFVHLKSEKHRVPVRRCIGRLISRGPFPTTLIGVLRTGGVQAQGVAAVRARQEETHESEKVGLIGVHALLQQQETQLLNNDTGTENTESEADRREDVGEVWSSGKDYFNFGVPNEGKITKQGYTDALDSTRLGLLHVQPILFNSSPASFAGLGWATSRAC